MGDQRTWCLSRQLLLAEAENDKTVYFFHHVIVGVAPCPHLHLQEMNSNFREVMAQVWPPLLAFVLPVLLGESIYSEWRRGRYICVGEGATVWLCDWSQLSALTCAVGMLTLAVMATAGAHTSDVLITSLRSRPRC